MKSFFKDTEKNGTGNMKSHFGLDRGQFIENLVF